MNQVTRAILALLIILAFMPVGGLAASTPAPEITTTAVIDGQAVDLDLTHTSDGMVDRYTLSEPVVTNEYQITSLEVEYKQHPYIAYGIAIIDTGAPSTFSFAFSEPAELTYCLMASSSMSMSTTDGGNDGVTVTAVAPPSGIFEDIDGITEVQVSTASDGQNRINLRADLGGPLFHTLKQSDTWGPFEEGMSPCPDFSADKWNSMRIDVNFLASGGGDAITLNGRSSTEGNDMVCPEFPALFLPAVACIGMLCAVMLVRIKK